MTVALWADAKGAALRPPGSNPRAAYRRLGFTGTGFAACCGLPGSRSDHGLLVSLVLSAALAALGQWWGSLSAGREAVLHAINFAVSFAVITGLFAAIYRIMPRAEIAWGDVWVGAIVTALLFTLGKSLIGLYLGKSAVTSGFGAAGSMVVLLVWVYYSAQIFLLGAEFTWVYAHASGSRATTSDQPARRGPTWRRRLS